jgi:hypothetical protein
VDLFSLFVGVLIGAVLGVLIMAWMVANTLGDQP